MGFKIGKALGSIAGAAVGGFFGGAPGATAGAGIGNALLGGNDDEMTALQAYQMQRADALSDWERQNAYNSPLEQMKRLQAAGLNPYLVYSGGNVTGNNSQGIDNVSYNGSYAQPVSKQLQNALANLNLRAMKADTKGKEVDTEMRELDLALKKARLASFATGGKVTKTPEQQGYDNYTRRVASMSTAERRKYWNSLRNLDVTTADDINYRNLLRERAEEKYGQSQADRRRRMFDRLNSEPNFYERLFMLDLLKPLSRIKSFF